LDKFIEENNTLYPIEIKKTANPGSGDIQNFSALKNETRKSLGQGALIYPGDQELYLDTNTKAVPVTMV
jgi:hypothetical protein